MVVFGNTRLTERHISRRDINTATLREMLSHYLEFLNLSSQGRVGADMLEERRLKANPQVGFLPVTVFLKDREGGDANRDIYKHTILPNLQLQSIRAAALQYERCHVKPLTLRLEARLTLLLVRNEGTGPLQYSLRRR